MLPPDTPDDHTLTSPDDRLLTRARAVLPEGTFAVGAGLIVAALTAYIFIILALNALDDQGDAGISAFWGLIFVFGPGVFLPLEQEVSRAVAHRRAQGIGPGPLIARAARLGGAITVLFVVGAAVFYQPLADELFKGQGMLVVGFAVGLVGFYVMHLARGTLSGNHRFRPYGQMLAIEGVVRLVAAVALYASGVEEAWAYALALALSPFVAVPIALWGQHDLVTPGPPAPYSELSEALGYLLVGSVLAQLLGYAALLAVNLLAGEGENELVASFASAFFVARIPILLFQAVQAALLPKLAGLIGAGRHDDFRAGLRRLMLVVLAVAVIGTVAAATIGPWAGKLLFEDFDIDNFDLSLLAAASGAYIVALTMAYALIALRGHARVAFAWLTGVVGFAITVSLISDLYLRVEIAFLVGSVVTAIVTGILLTTRMREGVPDSVNALVEAIEHEPLEI